MQHFLKIGGKRYGEVRNFKKVRKFASSNLKFRSSKFKFTEILICNPGIHNKSGHKLLVHLRLGDSLDGIPLDTGWDTRDNAGAPPYSATMSLTTGSSPQNDALIVG